MSYVVASAGTRIVGDNIEKFATGELLLLGSNIPHVWHNEKKYFEKHHHGKGQA